MSNTILQQGQILIYQADDGKPNIDVRLEDETVWLTQQKIADLFQTTVPNINMHIRNIVEEQELDNVATVKKFLTVRKEGKREVRRNLDHYNLDMIISVGYRIKSQIATRFRIWATQTLKQHLVEGVTLNRSRLESFGTDVEHLVDLVQKTLKSHELVFSIPPVSGEEQDLK